MNNKIEIEVPSSDGTKNYTVTIFDNLDGETYHCICPGFQFFKKCRHCSIVADSRAGDILAAPVRGRLKWLAVQLSEFAATTNAGGVDGAKELERFADELATLISAEKKKYRKQPELKQVDEWDILDIPETTETADTF